MTMTQEEFRTRWDSDEAGGGITYDDIADCAVAWGLMTQPRIKPLHEVRERVLTFLGIHEEKATTPNQGKENNMGLHSIITGIQPEPFRLLLHGVEGIGKSSFAAQAPDPVFIQTEDGLAQIDVPKFPLAESFDTVVGHLTALGNEEHDYQTVVLDSVDWLEKLAVQKILETHKDKTTLAEFDYGRGFAMLVPLFETIIGLLNQLRRKRKMHAVLIAHTKMEKVEDPSGSSYDQYAPRLDKRINGLMREWSDLIAFATVAISRSTEKDGFKQRVVAKAVKDQTGNDRVLILESTPAIVAKSRYALPPTMPLDGVAFFTEHWNIIHKP